MKLIRFLYLPDAMGDLKLVRKKSIVSSLHCSIRALIAGRSASFTIVDSIGK